MELKEKALFIDRDGTIIRDCPYCHKIEDLYIYQTTVELMRTFQEKNYIIIIITNQSGIGRGYFTEKEFLNFNNELVNRLKSSGVFIAKTYYCPHRPEDNCECRKPKPGMVLNAVSELGIDLKNSFIIGDRDDMEGKLARDLGIKYNIISHNAV